MTNRSQYAEAPKLSTKAVTSAMPKEPLDQLVSGPMSQGDLEVMFRSLKKAVIEGAMKAEMSDHLGYEPGKSKRSLSVTAQPTVLGVQVPAHAGDRSSRAGFSRYSHRNSRRLVPAVALATG